MGVPNQHSQLQPSRHSLWCVAGEQRMLSTSDLPLSVPTIISIRVITTQGLRYNTLAQIHYYCSLHSYQQCVTKYNTKQVSSAGILNTPSPPQKKQGLRQTRKLRQCTN